MKEKEILNMSKTLNWFCHNINMEENIDILEELNVAESILKIAAKDGLEPEIFVFAIKAMKENPNLSIIEAMYEGFDEWIK